MKKFRHFLKQWWLLLAIVLIIALFFAFHLSGFRVGPGLSIVRVGTLTIENVPQTASLYVDEVYTRRSGGGTEVLKLLPGSHQIAVSLDGKFPWYDYVSIASDTETKIQPLLIPLNPLVKSVGGDQFNTAASLISKTHLPTAQAPLAMAGGCALVSVSGNRIVADATTTPSCTPPDYLCTEGTCGQTVLFSPLGTLRTVIAYPGRDDAMIVSAGNNLFVLDVDPRNAFFAPLGKDAGLFQTPKAAVGEDGTVYVYSGVKFFTLGL